MARKIFVSYKYGDTGVLHIERPGEYNPTTARHYVNELQFRLDAEDHMHQGVDPTRTKEPEKTSTSPFRFKK